VTTHLGGWQLVWKLGPQKNLIPVAVQVGITDYNNSQLISGDLHEGDALVIAATQAAGSAGGQRPPGFGGGPGGPR
jgi:hypothetical protein